MKWCVFKMHLMELWNYEKIRVYLKLVSALLRRIKCERANKTLFIFPKLYFIFTPLLQRRVNSSLFVLPLLKESK